MTNEKQPLISVSDLFGVGKLANSPAATRLVDAIVSGVGELFFPWRLRRNNQAQIDVIQRYGNLLSGIRTDEIELTERTTARVLLGQKKDQLNRERIAERAIEDLSQNYSSIAGPDVQDCKLEQDWVEYFWEKAGSVTDSDMQGLWARVLTRKAVGHGVSLRTLDLLRTLSLEEAQVIEQLSKFRIAIGPDHRFMRNTIGLLLYPDVTFETDIQKAPTSIVVRGSEVVEQDRVPVDFRCRDLVGNPYSHILEPAGIYLDSSRSYRFMLNWNREPLPIQVGDRHYLVKGTPGGSGDGYAGVSFGTGIGFSQIGWELFSFASSEPSSEYLEVFREKLKQRGLHLEAMSASTDG